MKRKQIIPFVTVVMLFATIVVGASLSRSLPYGELSALHNVTKRTGSAVVATAPAPQSSQRFEAAPNVIAGGGGTSSGMTNQGGVISIDGTIGQAAAGTTRTPPPTQNPGAPIIYTEQGTDNVAALNSVTFVRSPFRLFDPHNFSADQRTRIIFFTSDLGLTQPNASVLTVQASGANLPVEKVGTLSGVPGLSGSYIIVRLPDGLPTGPLQLTITLRGLVSNVTILNISAPQQFANQPPSVNAGPDQTITLPVNTVNLVGTATDDGLPAGTLSVSWSRVSGPASVTFGNASVATTTATFSLAGTYVLRLTASDTQLASSDEVTITVNPAATASLTPEQRLAALDAVRAQFESLSRSNPDRNAVNQELLSFIRSRPEFAESGITSDSCVWARYTDGVELVVVNHGDLPDASSVSTSAVGPEVQESASRQPQPHPQQANVPDSDRARLVFAHGPGWDNPVPDVRAWLNDQNYTTSIGEGATVEALKKVVGGDGVFFFNGHGGTYGLPTDVTPQPYALGTATEVTLKNLDFRELGYDLEPNAQGRVRLRLMISNHEPKLGGNEYHKIMHYAITSQFIRDYWGDFGPNSFVFINACGSAPSGAGQYFSEVFREKKASVYAGWTETVHWPIAAQTARLVFDRLLGANKVFLENGFKQRPFDYPSVAKDLLEHGYGYDPVTKAQLEFKHFSGDFRLLAPSIARMDVDEEAEQLIINGIFSDNKGPNSRVTVDGQELVCAESDWKNGEIKCKLPATGPGSSGDVIVTERGHKSNVAQLTEWEGDFVVSINTDVGPHQQQGTIHARFRADAREWRPVIHNPPVITPDMGFAATMDSYLDYSCIGSSTYTYPGPPANTETVTWSGAGRVPRFTEDIVLSGKFMFPVGHFVNFRRIDVIVSYTAVGV
ncbi:MAG TPA: hypothetical protein VNA17_05460, partial [Pyrinomonadaceae bacterium]|nr:hypothetical protein [Pyrinomonadaceae bacterium]